jgi:YegS/Rv2252/BmrU family lipid kinase
MTSQPTRMTSATEANNASLIRGEGAPAEPQFKRVHVIVNPASGQDRPVLTILNDAFHPSGIDWDVFVTKETGDARRYAQAAIKAGVDAVGVYGGDGTVMEVASALINTNVPLAIFPGGTANVMSAELGVPSDPAEACAVVTGGRSTIRTIDVGAYGEHIFLTRLGIGLESNVIENTAREQKDRMGWVAYALNTLRELTDPKVSRYKLTLDGQVIETQGLTCVVANSGVITPNSGIPGRAVLSFAPGISVSDGVLDVVVIRGADLGSLLAVAASVVAGNENAEPLLHWRAREVTIEADPPQTIQLDGEILDQTPAQARVLPSALRVIVPPEATPPTATASDFEAKGQGPQATAEDGERPEGRTAPPPAVLPAV